MKLGKLAPKHDVRTLRFEKYAAPSFTPPATFDYTAKVSGYPMWLNDQLGDCTCAARAGLIATWTANRGSQVLLSDAQVNADYNLVNGGADNGAVELDVLKAWMGGMADGHKLAAYGDVGLDINLIKAATWLCEGTYIGVSLPSYCLNSTTWTQPSSIIAGGHAIFLGGFDGTNFIGVSWGKLIEVSPAFLLAQCDEVHFCLAQDQLNGQGVAASGVDLATMQSDVETVGTLDTPPIAPTPTPNPDPGPAPNPAPPPKPSLEPQVQAIGDQLFDAMASALQSRMIISGHQAAAIVESGKPAFDRAIKSLPW